MAFCLPIVFASFVGGTFYHATRSHEFWMYLDWIPIILLCLAVSVYFILKTSPESGSRLVLTFMVVLLVVGVRMIPWDKGIKLSAGYIGTALGLLLPLIVYLFRTKFRYFTDVFLAVLCFGVAITFRVLDRYMELLSMGTHWLWHSFGAFSVFFLIRYIYYDNEKLQSANQLNTTPGRKA